jgi:hypothetical protein
MTLTMVLPYSYILGISLSPHINLWIIPLMSSGMKEYKIPAWTRDKVFPSPDCLVLPPSGKGGAILHKILLQCIHNTETNKVQKQDWMISARSWILIPDAADFSKAYPEVSWLLLAAFCQNLFAPLKLKRLPSSVLIESRFTSWVRMESRFSSMQRLPKSGPAASGLRLRELRLRLLQVQLLFSRVSSLELESKDEAIRSSLRIARK